MVSALYNACSFVTLSNILRDLIPANHYTERQYMNVVYIDDEPDSSRLAAPDWRIWSQLQIQIFQSGAGTTSL